MKNLLFCLLFVSLTSCTFSINQIHTSGQASDVVDEDQKADANADVSLPLHAL